MTVPEAVDVIIIGSGPVGCTFARELSRACPDASILLVDSGPRLTDRAGAHIKNIADPEARIRAQVLSQGPTPYPYGSPSVQERADAATSVRRNPSILARPGTFLFGDANQTDTRPMPAAAMSANIGGMGAHWTCACPRPSDTERIQFIERDEWNSLCTRAESLLKVTRSGFPETPASRAIVERLGSVFNSRLSPFRPVGTMPLACSPWGQGPRRWSGPDVILDDLAAAHPTLGNFTLVAETVCLKLETNDHGAEAAILRSRPTGEITRVKARFYVIAGDAFRTPQLLAASSMGGRANGHYLNDQPQSICAVELKSEMFQEEKAHSVGRENPERVDSTIGVLWVPFNDKHPFHGQVMHFDTSPIPMAVTGRDPEKGHFVALGWFARKQVRFEDHIEFSTSETDYFGLPRMQIHYGLTDEDNASISASKQEQENAARAFGWFLPGGEPRTIPAGSSLHYQGTTRMGVENNGESVCNPFSQVWGVTNVFVGGNNVIPTSTACNPTLTAVALAIRSANRIASLLK